MIITKLQGGLANQIFQWAYAKNLSTKWNMPLILDTSFYNNQIGLTPRKFSLDHFENMEYELLSDNLSLISNKKFTRFIDGSDIKYDPSMNYYLDGYWQSEDLFKENEKVIRESLKPSESKQNSLNKTPLIDCNNVSIHIRRTDYLTSNGFHPVQSIDYYKNALDLISDWDYIFVFSDDIQWCKDNLQFKNMIFMSGFTDVEDIWLQSMCKNNIIANSSFSWWGAWLNENPNKKVIAPLNWFGSQSSDNIVPSSWIRI